MKIIDNIVDSFYLKINKIKESNFSEKFKYFFNNFWPLLFILFFLLIIFQIKMKFNSYFHTDKITKLVPNSIFVGNAIAINERFFLTTYNAINSACKIQNDRQNLVLFLIAHDGNYYKTKIFRESKDLNLIILELDDNTEEIMMKNYVVFSKKQDNLLDNNVYISKTKNSNKTHFYEKNKILEVSENGYYIKKNNLRNNLGESVLNNKLEFVGITSGNTEKSKYKFYSNKVDIISQGTIESFLRRNGIYYRKNLRDINLSSVNNYLKGINLKAVCYLDEKRMPLTIKIYR